MQRTSNQPLFNILYIEDDKVSRDITSLLLKKLSTTLIVAEDGLDGFIKFENNSIDLIITDLAMPNISGIDFIKMIRDIDQEVPIVILSAHINNEILPQCINYGIQGYINKPINQETLEKQINNIKRTKNQSNLINEYHNITDASAIITKVNQYGIITYVNQTYCKVSGFTKEELIGQKHSFIRSKEESPQFFESVWNKVVQKKEIWMGVLKHKTKNGKLYYLKTTIQPIVNKNGEIEQFITLSIPVTDIVHHEKQLSDYMKQHKQSVLFLVKIEEFKYLKHSFTHKITKRLQDLFAKELLKHMPKESGFDNVFILNNGKFAFIQEDFNLLNKEELTRILKVFQQKVNQQKIKIGIVDYTLSIVCSLAYGEEAFENAKLGLTKILQNKEDFIVATNFLKDATKKSTEKLHKLNMLKDAISSYRIISHYQPIIDNKTLEIEKFESLVRLIDKEGNILSPYHFLDIAKEGKYYHEITSIVLKNSFRALFNTDINISVNLSALDMEDEKTKNEFFSLLEKYKTEAHRITVEIVEDEAIENTQNVQHFIRAIKAKGVKIALDDFGNGFSNFTRIQYYQPDYLKIDGSLVKNIEHDEFSKSLVETIVFFAKKHNIKTIAEFVENENIYNILKDLGVDYSQGYYFAKAGALDEFISGAVL